MSFGGLDIVQAVNLLLERLDKIVKALEEIVDEMERMNDKEK